MPTEKLFKNNIKKPFAVFSAGAEKMAAEDSIGFFRKIRSFASVFLFASGLIALIPLLELLSLFLGRRKRAGLWRKTSAPILKYFFILGGLKIKIEGQRNFQKGKRAIYAANHLSGIDGLVLIFILGPDAIPLVAPTGCFSFPFSYWFRKMEYIDVQRSNLEKIKFKSSYKPEQAIRKAVRELRENHSLIIFPEGHIELQRRLLYFHTGAARIALAAVEKVVPVGIIDIDKIIVKCYSFISGTIKVVFGEPINLVDYYVKHIATIQEASLKLKKEIIGLLPKRYFPFGDGEKHPEKTAVLFNIDYTLYHGNAQRDFIIYLWRAGAVDLKYLLTVFYYYLLSEFNAITKEDLFNNATLILKDWPSHRLEKSAMAIFDKKLKFNIYEKIRTLIKDHKERGHKIILVTKMAGALAKCFADYIEADYWVSLCLEESKLKYTGGFIEKCFEEDKAKQVLRLEKILKFNLKQSFGYGHDEEDLPMLKLVKYKTLVNPKKSLKAYGRKRGYEILEI
ncbi:1-acyl-sn-glycerol-3-phosphate acyltransferase [Patescibacteria group bacterium]|nr:1-acyl-sn-glycerol-3-phosphate acyltransferase [Patescibacteria group bacterium]